MTKKQYFLSRNRKMDVMEKQWCTDFCKAFWKEEWAHIMRIADEVKRDIFVFDLSWDMEQTNVPVSFQNGIDWAYKPGEDEEFIYQLNRHRYWICLGQAYAMTGNEEYAEGFVRQLTAWIKDNPLNEETKKTSWRTIEAGIRAENWIKAMDYFEESPYVTDAVIESFYRLLIIHADYLLASYSAFKIQSNWGILESRGLFLIGCALPDYRDSGKYIREAIKRLKEELFVQIMDDGVHWEQSPMYHNEVLHCCLEIVWAAEQAKIQIPGKIKAMSYVNLKWKKPCHSQIMAGDSDDTDVRDMLTKSAWIFKDPYLKSGGFSRMDFEGVWDFGRRGCEEYALLESREPKERDYELADSGHYILRSDWSEEAHYLHFQNGSLGGGHGHFDKLHFDLVTGGEDVLMDSGRYTYVYNKDRVWFKGAAAHNTIMVDGQEYTECENSWSVKHLMPPVKQGWIKKGPYILLQGGHTGYMQCENGVYIQRMIIQLEPGLYAVADECFASGKHTCEQFFHFNPDGFVDKQENKIIYSGKKAKVELFFLSADSTIKIENTRISRHYNDIENNKTAVISACRTGIHTFLTVIAGSMKEAERQYQARALCVEALTAGRMLSAKEAEAAEIKTEEGLYIVLINHCDTAGPNDLIQAGGCRGMGRVLVYKDTAGCRETTVLIR